MSRFNDWGTAKGNLFRSTAFPLILILFSPWVPVVLWMTATHFDGSLLLFAKSFDLAGFLAMVPRPSWEALKILGIFVGFELALLLLLPGKRMDGPVTPQGNRPVYKLNGVLAYAVTHLVWYAAAYWLDLFSPTVVYDHFGSLFVTSSILAFVFCIFLYFKGRYAPSSSDHGATGNVVWDFYWGTELHPTLGGISLKQLINCRVGMMGWSIIILSFAAKQAELSGGLAVSMAVCVAVQVIYIVKFFIWEGGYFASMDIQHDRFGFYICWGILGWLPTVYTVTALYLVNNPTDLPFWAGALILAFGTAMIWANWDADEQRQRVRRTKGDTTVWGKPPKLIHAEYETGDGERRKSILLVSGWWGLGRHIHYVTELGLAFAWSVPALFGHLLPWFYWIYLAILLTDRAFRDEKKCAVKYGEYWTEYKKAVPWRILPGVF